jgi:hypothetical protein
VPSRQRPGAAALGRAIDQVLLVGGATRMPCVQRLVAAMTARPVALGADVDPDEAVALGAALQAGALEGSVSDVETLEVWQAALMRALARKQMESDESDDADDADAEEAAFEAALAPDAAERAAQPARLPSADEMEELLTYEASVHGDELPLDVVADRAARYAARWRGRAAEADEEDEFEGMDVDEIAALGLSEGASAQRTLSCQRFRSLVIVLSRACALPNQRTSSTTPPRRWRTLQRCALRWARTRSQG